TVRIPDNAYGIDRTGNRICQKGYIPELRRERPRSIIGKGQTGNAGPPDPKFMQRRHKRLIRTQTFIANARQRSEERRVGQETGVQTCALPILPSGFRTMRTALIVLVIGFAKKATSLN